MKILEESAFRKEIEKDTLSGAYLLYGEESYTLQKAVQKILQKAKAGGFADFNLQRFDAAEQPIETIAAAAEALPFFAEKRYLFVRDCNPDSMAADALQQLSAMIEDLPESSVLILYCANVQPGKYPSAKWKQLLQAQNLTAVEFRKKSSSELEKYLISFAEKRGCILTRELAKRMLRHCGTDLETLSREIAKLCGFAGSGEITKVQMDTVLTRNQEAQIFALSKAMLGGRYAEAYGLIEQLLQQGEEPVAIVAMLSSAYLHLYRAKCMLQSGKSVQELRKPLGYQGKDFLLRNAEQDCRRFSMQTLEKSLDLLLEADYQLKGGAGSSRDSMKRVVLDTLIAKLLLVAQEG